MRPAADMTHVKHVPAPWEGATETSENRRIDLNQLPYLVFRTLLILILACRKARPAEQPCSPNNGLPVAGITLRS